MVYQASLPSAPAAPNDEMGSNHVIRVIQSLEVMIQNAGEADLPYVQEVLDHSKTNLLEWIATSEYYMPVRDTLMRMLHADIGQR